MGNFMKSYKNPKDFDNLMIVDFLNLCFRFKHSGKKNFASEAINTVQSLAKSYEARDIVVCGDWGSAWRKSIYPEYKANRLELREKQTEQEANDFKEFLEEVTKAMDILSTMYIVFKIKGVEADDIAAYISTEYGGLYSHTWLISTDKDWDLLIKPNTSRFSYITRKEITWDNWNNYYDYDQEDHISIKVLHGDSGDNVKGIDGIGEKRAYQLVKEYGTAYDIYNALPIESNYKYIQNLNASGDLILLNYELMDLETYCAEAVGREGVELIDKEFIDVP